mgnify:CR=1 FL=1
MLILRITSRLVTIPIYLSVLSLSACSPLKFYPGEERADSTIGRLLFNSSGAALSAVTIDGIPHPKPGKTVELLPGSHQLSVQYQEKFADTDTTLSDGSSPADKQSAVTLTRIGTCELRFSIDASQELFLFVDAGSHPLAGASIPPTITLKEEGFDKPALYQERCREDGRIPKTKAVS